MASIGNKYIVEIDDKVLMDGRCYAVMKGLPKILLSENDLDILEKYEPQDEKGFKVGDLVEVIRGKYRGQKFYITNSFGLNVDGIDNYDHTYRVGKTDLFNTGERSKEVMKITDTRN